MTKSILENIFSRKYAGRHFCGAIFIISFIIVAVLMSMGKMADFDDSIRYFFYGQRSHMLTKILTFITHTGDWKTIVIVSIFLLFIKKSRFLLGIPLSAATITSVFFYGGLKLIFRRSRPDILLHLVKQGGYSFPSGHSMNCLMFYGMIIFLVWRIFANKQKLVIPLLLSLILGLNIIMIGLSRIYLGVHYPSDVLAGWLLSAGFLIEATVIYDAINEQRTSD